MPADRRTDSPAEPPDPFAGPSSSCSGPLDSILMIKPNVEPDGRIESPVLMQAQPSQLAIELLSVFFRGEITVFNTPIGDRTSHSMNQLANAGLAFLRADFAIKVLADHDIRRQLTPSGGNLTVRLFKQDFSRFVLDGRRAEIPLHGFKRIVDVRRTKRRGKLQSVGIGGNFHSFILANSRACFSSW